MSWSIRARLTLCYSALMVVALSVFGIGVLWLHARWAHVQFDAELADLAASTSRAMGEELAEGDNLSKAVSETLVSMNVPGRTTAILDRRGTPMGAHWHGFSYDAAIWPADARPRLMTVASSGAAWRVLLRHEPSSAGEYGILVAGPLDQLARQQHLLARVLLVATPLIVLATAGLSWWVASSALHPVTMMAAQAEAITIHSPDWRLQVPSVTDELGQLARAFNQLLGRLAASSQAQRQFMADASHELRTPVSVILTATEVTLERDVRDSSEYRDALTVINEQSARLSRMVEDMFVLARADAGGYRLSLRAVYVDEIVQECVRAAALVAATKDIRIASNVQPDIGLRADDGLLRQLVTNLLDNAMQYTPGGGAINVTVESGAGRVSIAVSDTGSGIAAADRGRVFERFVRLDPARASTSGAGLGLPIARWIAEQHGGTIAVETNAAGGSVFIVWLPLNMR